MSSALSVNKGVEDKSLHYVASSHSSPFSALVEGCPFPPKPTRNAPASVRPGPCSQAPLSCTNRSLQGWELISPVDQEQSCSSALKAGFACQQLVELSFFWAAVFLHLKKKMCSPCSICYWLRIGAYPPEASSAILENVFDVVVRVVPAVSQRWNSRSYLPGRTGGSHKDPALTGQIFSFKAWIWCPALWQQEETSRWCPA